MPRVFVLLASAVLSVLSTSVFVWAESELPLILKEDFEHGMTRWQTTDPKDADPVWKIIEAGSPGNHVLRCTGPSKYQLRAWYALFMDSIGGTM